MNKTYYYNANDIFSILGFDLITPYDNESLASICEELNIDLTKFPYNVSSDLLTDFWQRVITRYKDEYYFRIKKECYLPAPDNAEITNEFGKWILRFLNFIAQTHEYYSTLLSEYATAKDNLMADIKATSKNKVKFNDTPQNPNNAGIYEGDDYITHFTATEGETSSPLMSKMMRLKEIQDHFKNLWADWVNKAEKLFIEGENV